MTTPSPLRRLAALRGSTKAAAEASIALWSNDERNILRGLDILDSQGSLTGVGAKVLHISDARNT